MTIMLDMDGVLCDWNTPFASLLASLTGRGFAPEPGWPSVWHWPQAAGYTTDDLQKTRLFLQENPQWWFYLPPTPEASRLLADRRLLRLFEDHDVIVVTNRTTLAKPYTQMWLTHWIGIEAPTVLTVAGDKGPIIDALDVDLAIDDKPANLTTATSAARLFLVDAPYNQHEDDPRLERGTLVELFDELYPLSTTVTAENPYEPV